MKQLKLLEDNRVILDRISDYLYEKETITGKEFMKMFREMKGIPETDGEDDKKDFFEQAMEAENNDKDTNRDYVDPDSMFEE